jgi:hypothetical protein
MFARQIHRNPFEEVVIAPQLGEAYVLCGECKMFVSNSFRKLAQRLIGIHLATTTYEQLVVY